MHAITARGCYGNNDCGCVNFVCVIQIIYLLAAILIHKIENSDSATLFTKTELELFSIQKRLQVEGPADEQFRSGRQHNN